MSVLGLMTGSHTLLVGVEDDPDGGLRCYLGARWKGLYCVVDHEDDQAKVRRAWNGARGHVTFPVPPPEAIFCDEQPPSNATDEDPHDC